MACRFSWPAAAAAAIASVARASAEARDASASASAAARVASACIRAVSASANAAARVASACVRAVSASANRRRGLGLRRAAAGLRLGADGGGVGLHQGQLRRMAAGGVPGFVDARLLHRPAIAEQGEATLRRRQHRRIGALEQSGEGWRDRGADTEHAKTVAVQELE